MTRSLRLNERREAITRANNLNELSESAFVREQSIITGEEREWFIDDFRDIFGNRLLELHNNYENARQAYNQFINLYDTDRRFSRDELRELYYLQQNIHIRNGDMSNIENLSSNRCEVINDIISTTGSFTDGLYYLINLEAISLERPEILEQRSGSLTMHLDNQVDDMIHPSLIEMRSVLPREFTYENIANLPISLIQYVNCFEREIMRIERETSSCLLRGLEYYLGGDLER